MDCGARAPRCVETGLALGLALALAATTVAAQDRGTPQETATRIETFVPAQASVGGTVTVQFSVLGELSLPLDGNVEVQALSGESCMGPLSASGNPRVAVGSCDISSLTSGVKVFTASYVGLGGHLNSSSPPKKFLVGQVPSDLTIVVDAPNPSLPGQGFVVSGRVGPGLGNATGSIEFTHGPDSCLATLPNPSCIFTSTITGSIGLAASYSGDAFYAGSSASPISHEVLAAGPNRRLPDSVAFGDFAAPNDFLKVTDITPDGRYLVFESSATNLVQGLRGGTMVFRYDRLSKEILPASVRNDGSIPLQESEGGRISADGRFVAFASFADDLVPGDGNTRKDVFVRDLVGGTTELVSKSTLGVVGNQDSSDPDISDDGQRVVFTSTADTLVAGDSNGVGDVFLHDRGSATTTRVSVGPLGQEGVLESFGGVISGDGSSVAFVTANPFDTDLDFNGVFDVYVRRVDVPDTLLASRNGSGDAGNGPSYSPSLNHDGRIVAYASDASDLNGGDNNGVTDVFVSFVDSLNAPTQRISVAANGDEANGHSRDPRISADGYVVAFLSEADNLLPGDMNSGEDVFVRDIGRVSGATTQLISADAGGAFPIAVVDSPAISGDGRYVAFRGFGQDLVVLPDELRSTMYLRDRAIAETQSIGRAPLGRQPNDSSADLSISADGSALVIYSGASNLVAGDNNGHPDLFLVGDALPTQRLSTRSDGAELDLPPDPGGVLSGDGSWVAFTSSDTAVITGIVDVNGSGSDVFLLERMAGPSSLILVSRSFAGPLQTGDANSYLPDISADGRYVAFISNATDLLSAPLSSGVTRAFLYDRIGQTMELVSVDSGGSELDGTVLDLSISNDGCRIAFTSDATSGPPVTAPVNVFLRIRAGCPDGPATLLVSQTTAGVPADDFSFAPRIAGNGLAIAFQSEASNLGAAFFEPQSFLRRLPPLVGSADTIMVSLDDMNVPFPVGSEQVDVDDQGLRVLVLASTPGLRPTAQEKREQRSKDWFTRREHAKRNVRGPGGSGGPLYLRDLGAGVSTLVSLDRFGLPTGVSNARISGDGQRAAVVTFDDDFGVGDSNGTADVYVFDLPPSGGGGANCIWDGSVGNWSDPGRWIDCGAGSGSPAGTPGPVDTAQVGSGTVMLDVPVLVDGVSLSGGRIEGGQPLIVTGLLQWTGGQLAAPSPLTSLTVTASATAILSGGQKTLESRTLLVEGTANWSTGLIELADGGVLAIAPGGVFNVNPAAMVETIFESGADGALVVNDGSVVKFGTQTAIVEQEVEYLGSGSIQVNGGRLVLRSPGLFDGSYATSGPGELQFSRSARVFGSSAVFGGGSTFIFGELSGSLPINIVDGCFAPGSRVILLDSGLQLQCPSPQSFAELRMLRSFSRIGGFSDVVVTGHFQWSGGDLFGDPLAPVTLAAGATGEFDDGAGASVDRVLAFRPFINQGSILWSGYNDTLIESGASFVNEGSGSVVVDLAGNAPGFVPGWASASVGALVNQGLYQVLDAVEHEIALPFENQGSFQSSAGTTFLSGPGSDTGSYQIVAPGVLRVRSPAALRILDVGSSVSGSGRFAVSEDADVQIDGALSIGQLEVSTAAELRVDTSLPATVGVLTLGGGILGGAQRIEVGGGLQWDAGSVRGSGGSSQPLVLEAGSNSVIQTAGLKRLSERALQVNGQLSHTAGEILVPIGESAVVDIGSSGGSWVFNSNMEALGMRCESPGCTIAWSSEGTLGQIGSVMPVLELSSPLQVLDGSFDVAGAGLNVGQVQMFDGLASIATGSTLVASSLQLSGGELRGSGTLTGDLTNLAGSVQPGGSAIGTLVVQGNYTQTAGSLEIQVAGALPGSGHDLLSIGGGATLDGQLMIIDSGYTPVDPEVLTLLTATGGRSGTFPSVLNPYAGYVLAYAANHVALAPEAGPSAIVVNSINDPGDGSCDASECTLREAIELANAQPGPDVIHFDIPGAGPHLIVPSNPLPTITGPVLIDGYTQSGAVPNSIAGFGGHDGAIQIELQGQSQGGGSGLVFDHASGVASVRGLALNQFAEAAIEHLPGGEGLVAIEGNFLGTAADGVSAFPGQGSGVRTSAATVIGGPATLPAARNVIAGFSGSGVEVLTDAIAIIENNLIGTDRSGVQALGNQAHGVYVEHVGPTTTRVGVFANLISGNGEGIRLDCANSGSGCFDQAEILGNRIGSTAAGDAPLPNLAHGIHVSALVEERVEIGGVMPGDGNLIAYNQGDGVRIQTSDQGRVAVIGDNRIFANALLGIDLGGDGRTPNDPDDVDDGANGLQNFPVFEAFAIYLPDPLVLAVDYRIDTPVVGSPENYPIRVDFFKAEGGQGRTWLGSDSYSESDAQSLRSIFLEPPPGVSVSANDVLLAVATTAYGQSSEFSFYGSQTTIVADVPDPTAPGESYTVTVEVEPESPTPFVVPGAVDIEDGRGGSCRADLAPLSGLTSAGACIIATVGPAGTITLTATYDTAGQAFLASSDTEDHDIVAGMVPTATAISAINPPSTVVGEPYQVFVAVTQGGKPVSQGMVEVLQLSDGATCLIDLDVASSCSLVAFTALTTAVRASYLGSGALQPSASAAQPHPVQRAETAVQIVSAEPDPSPAGQPIEVEIELPVVAPGAGEPSGQVLITDGTASCAITLPELSCALLPKAFGEITIEARYLGDANYNPSVDTEAHTVIAEGADLSIIKRNGLRILPGGLPSTYVILVSNSGPQDVVNARVTDILPPQLTNASWTCTAADGASCPASGSGNIDALVHLPAGSSVSFLLTVTAQVAPEQIVSNVARVTPPVNAEDPNLDNNESVDTDPIGIFGDGLETEFE